MKDILKSGILGIVLIGTLVFSAPILNDNASEEMVTGSETTEQKIEKDIHIPL
jgi:hypothetical protein